MDGERNINDENHYDAFGEHTNIHEHLRHAINQIRNNDPDFRWFRIDYIDVDVEQFSDLAWELLGRYIAINDHLEMFNFACPGLSDAIMILLFKHLTRSTSLQELDLSGNDIGLSGFQSMIPFLKNSPRFKALVTNHSSNISAECFSVLINALHGGSIENLQFGKCDLEDITALETYSLPNLKILHLYCNNIRIIPSMEKYTNLVELRLTSNNIGRQGCSSISNLLENKGSCLRYLFLDSNDIGDEEAEILANSLINNITLMELWLGDNKFKEKGLRAFLMLLNDISSIERTSNSNHTLTTLKLPKFTHLNAEMEKHVYSSLNINRRADAPRQKKVINTQLNSITRMKLCHLQGIDYSYTSIFAEIDDVLLPNVIALVEQNHGQNELYRMLIVAAPGLASIVNRRAALTGRIAENLARETSLNVSHARRVEAMNAKHARKVAALREDNLRKIAALATKRLEMERELESIESARGAHAVDGKNVSSVKKPHGKKRGRDE